MLVDPALSGKTFAVYGLARTGMSVARMLCASGAHVIAWDDSPKARARAAETLADVEFSDLMAIALDRVAGLLVSPGVPLHTHPLAKRARAANVPILGDIEMFARLRATLPTHKVVGVTGTNGKSTTTALIHHLLTTGGVPARLGGNIGLPILDADPLPAGGVYVLELSSFQIDLCHSLACDVVVFTNLTPDHLDRHTDMAGYAAAKERLFAMQKAGGVAVIATDDAYTRAAAARLPERVRPIVVSAADTDPALQARWPALAGPHNAQNIACAVATARTLGVSDAAIEQGLASFRALAHRMQPAGEIAGVRYVNDSKATNPTSTAPALQAYDRVHWIVGGQAKSRELDACLPHLSHVAAAYVIGDAAPLFAEILRPHVPVVHSHTLAQAVRDAAAAARPGDTVLLSPACASYDQFTDFEARGDAFLAAVEGLRP